MIQQDPLRRDPAFLDFGDFRLDLANRLLYRAGEPVDLTPKAFDTLLVLVRRAGQVVPKDALIEEIWPSSFVSEATLSQNIYILRRLLDPEDTRRWIRTLPRRGYRFEGEVVAVDGDPAAPAGLPEGASAASVGIADIRSLAVLPLRPLRQDEEGVFLGLGIADAVITSLSNLRQLSVRATSAILRYADGVEGGGGDVAAIGRDLGVEGVLEGTVQRSGSRLRVTLQLISVASGVPCWAESFRGDYDDLFVAQDAVAREVVRRLRLTLTQGEASSFARPPTESLEAYRTYVRGRYSWNRRSAADLRRAIELFRQAVSEDPTYARAYSGLADALILLPFYGSARPTDAFRQAREAARRALELDDRLAEARTSLAYTDFIYSRDWPAAESGFLRSLEQDPSYPTACHWYAFMLTALGRHGEAIEMAGRAHHLDPLSLVISTDLALAYYFARRFEEAQAHLAGVVEVAPDFGYAHFALALCSSQMGRHDDAVEAGRRAVEILGDSMAARAALGFSLARGGQVVEARSLLGGGDGALTGGSLRALVLTGLGDSESAFDELDLAIEDRSRFAVLLGVWPAFDPLRGDPRFPDLLRRLSLSGP
ncbi:MAG: winged helix-turn-helix domain-containing protein [Acidobacteriota bacterium]